MSDHPLAAYIEANGLNEEETMNRLQEAGMISDNCVAACDVATADIQRAINYLQPW